MASGSADLSAFFNPPLCANTDQKINGEISPCQQNATLACGSCKLVQYCSKECQKQGWRLHKPICKGAHMKESWQPRWTQEKRHPMFVGIHPPEMGLAAFGSLQYFWGNIPALDVLGIDNNEGVNSITSRDISLLFAASGDLRNVVKSISGLPEDYHGQATVVVNDINNAITSRNTILLLVALHFEPEIAAPMMIRLWYSALLPWPMALALHEHVLPPISKVCASSKSKSDLAFHAETFQFGDTSLQIVLKKSEWYQLMESVKISGDISPHEAMKIRQSVMLAQGRRTGVWKFRHDGLLLPYGCSRKHYCDVPNPTLYQTRGLWPMKDESDPLDGWAYEEYMKHATPAKNDVYGALFFYLRDLLLKFCQRNHKSKMEFHAFAVDATELRSYLHEYGLGVVRFDRIDVSNICVRGYIGPAATLASLSSLLKSKKQNPHATLIMLFLNAVREEEHHAKTTNGPLAMESAMTDSMRQLGKYMDLSHTARAAFLGTDLDEIRPEVYKIMSALDCFGDFDYLFKKFMRNAAPGSSIHDLAREYGVRAKRNNTIVEKWPFRVKDTTTKEQFKVMLSEGTCGHERYMEFEKAE